MFPRQGSSSPQRIPQSINLARDSCGLSMLELIMAFVVLQIAIVAFAQFFTAGLDISRSVRRTEMAQILGQAIMEELMREMPSREPLNFPEGTDADSRSLLLNERPGTFEQFAAASPEDINSFVWIAEANPSPVNDKLVNLTLHVYSIRKRPMEEKADKEDFYLSNNRRKFTFVHALGDGSIEFMAGKEELRLSSAIALP